MREHTRFLRLRGLALMASLVSLTFPAAVGAQDTKARPTIEVPAIVLIEPMVETALPIQVGPADALPRNCFLRVKGLPSQAVFSDGHFVSPGTWALPLAGLNALKLTLPISASGRNELQLAVVAIDGTILADAKVTLAVTAGALASPPGSVQAPPAGARAPGSASLGPPNLELAQPAPPRPAPQHGRSATNPAASAPMKPEDRERAMKLLARGDAEFTGGDVAAARLLYQRAADAGLADAAIAMGGTFDPAELSNRRVKGLVGEPEIARKWYELARVLGAAGAEDRLRRVSAP